MMNTSRPHYVAHHAQASVKVLATALQLRGSQVAGIASDFPVLAAKRRHRLQRRQGFVGHRCRCSIRFHHQRVVLITAGLQPRAREAQCGEKCDTHQRQAPGEVKRHDDAAQEGRRVVDQQAQLVAHAGVHLVGVLDTVR